MIEYPQGDTRHHSILDAVISGTGDINILSEPQEDTVAPPPGWKAIHNP